MKTLRTVLSLLLLAMTPCLLVAQEQSVKPGINKSYEKADLQQKVKQFENENRDVVRHLDAIVDACQLKPGMDVADIGAGTGLFTRPFAPKVGPKGTIYAVDITEKFLEHVEQTCKEEELANVKCVLCTPESTELPPDSIDLAFTCNTYHHFEYPFKTLASIHRALRDGGRLIIVDFERKEDGPKWILGHVRADKETVVKEATDAGFKFDDEVDLMKTQYLIRFTKEAKDPG